MIVKGLVGDSEMLTIPDRSIISTTAREHCHGSVRAYSWVYRSKLINRLNFRIGLRHKLFLITTTHKMLEVMCVLPI